MRDGLARDTPRKESTPWPPCPTDSSRWGTRCSPASTRRSTPSPKPTAHWNTAELLADATGTIAEIGAGTGANFRHYPRTVEQVIAVEPEPRLRALVGRAAAECPVPVAIRAGRAEALPLPDASVDGVVASLVLCTIADVPAALGEPARVLRPGGCLYFQRAHPIDAAQAWPDGDGSPMWCGHCWVAAAT
ncbi:class I SAM-dependent methyltransferase [Streptomyces sp. NPDC020845]|uniref:class I SAM-dependent methyltransferase n=1 Tax=Streptomyces sp. NPDC020845 TaxID=3365096 RepID=UPI0037A85EA3